MKHKLSITIDEELMAEIQSKLRSGVFRNKSHLVEFAINKLLREE